MVWFFDSSEVYDTEVALLFNANVSIPTATVASDVFERIWGLTVIETTLPLQGAKKLASSRNLVDCSLVLIIGIYTFEVPTLSSKLLK